VHAGAVHEGELAQVEHGEVRQLLRLTQRPCELWCRRDVQLADDVDPGGVQAAVGRRAGEGGRQGIRVGEVLIR
jgi:hypothetical protein